MARERGVAMAWLAVGYGLLLGAAQFYLVKALVKYAVTQRKGPAKLPAAVLFGLVGYMAAALGAVYLFERQLAPTALGLGAGFFLLAGVWLARKLKRMN